ncbi:MAG: hypothetical protein JWO76_929 [Nocardioides sp.]|nr:hypothetical protein [Nocardioides sp.]
MKMLTRTTALTTAAALLTAPAIALAAAPAHADGPEKHAQGAVGGGRYDINIEKENGFDVGVDLEGIPASSTWKLVVKHDGKRVSTQTANSRLDDGRHEVDFRDVRSKNTKGKDSFTVKISRVDGAGSVTRTLTFAS